MIRRPDPLVSIIVITLNTPRMTGACLRSVRNHTTLPYELIVVNNSRAGAIRRELRRHRNLRVLQNRSNLGFSKAANQGILKARGRFICLLNSDALVPPGWLERLLPALELPQAGAVGPRSQDVYRFRFPWPPPGVPADEESTAAADALLRNEPGPRFEEAPYLTGFCLLMPRVVIARMGLFDEGYFFGLEDIDYSFRMRAYGYRLFLARRVFVHHRGGASSTPAERRRLVRASERRFRLKWSPPLDRALPSYTALVRRWETGLPPRKPPLPPLPSRRLFSGAGPRRGRPAVTVMMAAHNAERWIGQAVESVLAQTLPIFELIICDDASTDRTVRIAERYLRDARVRLIVNPVPLGAAAARNRILRAARGKFLAVCDAEDAMRPTHLKRFVEILENRPRTGWVYADRLIISAGGRPLSIQPALSPLHRGRMLRKACPPHAGSMLRREWVEAAGGYDERCLSHAGYALGLRFPKRNRPLPLAGEIHYHVREHPDRIDRTNPWAHAEIRRAAREAARG